MSLTEKDEWFIEQQKQYWSERTYAAMEAVQRNADNLLDELLTVHQNAFNSLTDSLSQKLAELGIDKSKWNEKISPQDAAKLKQLLQEALDSDREGLMSSEAKLALDISRLDALLLEIDLQLTKIAAEINNTVAEAKRDTYESVFNDFSNELESFVVTNKKAVELVVNKIWAAEHFSSSIWKAKQVLMKKLHTTISNGILTGASYDRMAKELAQAMESSLANAVRIVRTETAYMMNQATQDSYMNCKVTEGQEWLTCEDERTCKICNGRNGEQFYYEAGTPSSSVHTPPAHPHCRCTIIPIIKRPTKESTVNKKDESNSENRFKYLEDEYGIEMKLDGVSASDIPEKYLTSINTYLAGVYKKYPKLLEEPFKLRSIEFYDADYNETAAYSPSENSFTVNLKHFLNLKRYNDDDPDSIKQTFDSGMRTFIHETAHYFDFAITRKTGKSELLEKLPDGDFKYNPKESKLFSTAVYRNVKNMMEAQGDKLDKKTIRAYLGDYASTKNVELFAEAYATATIGEYIDNLEITNDYTRRYFDSSNKLAVQYKVLIEDMLNKNFK